MSRPVIRLWRIAVTAMSIPIILLEYFRSDTGREYEVGLRTKVWLLYRMAKNGKKIKTTSHWLEHLVMATEILKVPRHVQGCVVECGSFQGGSAANLSLICALCNRRLEIFDSFEGLPEPSGFDASHIIVNEREVHTYAKGAFRGTLPDVQKNISKFGQISVCDFNAGYFSQTLPGFRKRCVLAFLDVDLAESLKTCLTYLWPLLQEGCCLFTHEAQHLEVAGIFFDGGWWKRNLQCKAPGRIGAGSGLGLVPSLGGFTNCVADTVSNPAVADFKLSPQTGVFP